MKGQKVLHSRASDIWSTPQGFFDNLDKSYHFTLDPCADKENAKCKKFYTEEDDGLSKSWEGESVFMNPPYSNAKEWVIKAYEESKKPNTLVVCLLAARTDTKMFHDICLPNGKIIFIKGRLKFGGNKNPAPFPSMLVIFGKRND